MAEVTRQLGPLELKVGKLSNSIERLYNSNGGPPGFLQTARAEDNQRFESIASMLEEFKRELQPLKTFMGDHIASEKQKEKDEVIKAAALAARVEDSERRFKRWLALATLFLGVLTVLMNLHGCGNQLKSMLLSQNQTQSAHTPNLTR